MEIWGAHVQMRHLQYIATCTFSDAVKYHTTARFRDIDLGGAGGDHEPPAHGDVWTMAFIEPLFAPNSPGSDLFALRDGESIKKMEGRSEIEMKRGSSFV